MAPSPARPVASLPTIAGASHRRDRVDHRAEHQRLLAVDMGQPELGYKPPIAETIDGGDGL